MRIFSGKMRIVITILAVGIVTGAVGLWIGHSIDSETDPVREPNEADVLSLASPAFARSSEASFLEDEAGISLYYSAGQDLDLSKAKEAFEAHGYVETETPTYIIGSIALEGLPESDDVHCYVQKDGWIVVYYPKDQPLSKIVDWRYYSENRLTTDKLKEGMLVMSDSLSINPTDSKYYHWQFTDAKKWMIIIETQSGKGTDSFNLNIPSTLTVYDRSWSHRAGSGKATNCGVLTLSQLAPDTTHVIDATGYSGPGAQPGTTVYRSYLMIDGTQVILINGSSISEVAICLIYEEA